MASTGAGAVLDEDPAREGFRETTWWAQTRQEIVENARRSLEALAELAGDSKPHRHDAAFGLRGRPPLVVRQDAGRFTNQRFPAIVCQDNGKGPTKVLRTGCKAQSPTVGDQLPSWQTGKRAADPPTWRERHRPDISLP